MNAHSNSKIESSDENSLMTFDTDCDYVVTRIHELFEANKDELLSKLETEQQHISRITRNMCR